MPKALLINANMRYEHALTADIKSIPGIGEAYALYETYHVLVKVELESMDKLKELIATKIRMIKCALTMLIADHHSPRFLLISSYLNLFNFINSWYEPNCDAFTVSRSLDSLSHISLEYTLIKRYVVER